MSRHRLADRGEPTRCSALPHSAFVSSCPCCTSPYIFHRLQLAFISPPTLHPPFLASFTSSSAAIAMGFVTQESEREGKPPPRRPLRFHSFRSDRFDQPDSSFGSDWRSKPIRSHFPLFSFPLSRFIHSIANFLHLQSVRGSSEKDG